MRKKVFIMGALCFASAVVCAEPLYLVHVYAAPDKLAEEISYELDVAASTPSATDVVASEADLRTLRAAGLPFYVKETIDPLLAPPSEYTTYDELMTALQNLETQYPTICKLYDIGDTWESRQIWALKISDNPTENEAGEKDILINGNHHAREVMTVEVPLYLAQQLCVKYPGDPDVKLIVENVETWIVPMLNPDGHNWVFTNYNMWRKNRRNNGGSYGVDLNRNYDYHWGESGASHTPSSDTYCGPNAFSEPETQALRDLLNNSSHQFEYCHNYHSYGRDMLFPWAYQQSWVEEPDRTYYVNLANYLLEGMMPPWDYGNDWTCLGYVASGNAVDWDYAGTGHSRIWGFTFEIDTTFQPPASQIPITCAEQYNILIKLLKLGVSELGGEVSFRGTPDRGGVKLLWETNSGAFAGFNLYRRSADKTKVAAPSYEKVNDALVVGRSPYRYRDTDVIPGGEYEYMLEAVDPKGLTETFGPVPVKMPSAALKTGVALYQNRPNPARGTTAIRFDLAQPAAVTLAVYDMAGRRVRTLARESYPAGSNEITWDLTADDGRAIAPGVYIYRLEGAGETLSRRLVAAP